VLLGFVLSVVTFILGYLLYLRHHELSELRTYVANLETDILQGQIKAAETAQYVAVDDSVALTHAVDTVTGLPAPEVFDDRAKQIYHLSKRFNKIFSILFLEIPNFAAINRDLGDENANLLLSEIAKQFNGCIRQIDTVARFKNDIFVFLLPQLSQPEAAAYVAERLLEKLKHPFYIHDNPIQIEARIGIAVFPSDSDNLNTLFDHANSALQNAKLSENVHYHFYNSELQKISEREAKISRCLNTPLLAEKIVSYCLPQINVTNNQIMGIKVVAYIEDPELGLLKQSDYQRIAEKENKTLLIFECLMTRAIAQFPHWSKNGLAPNRLAIAVNAQQLQHKHFAQTVSDILEKTGFDPHLVAFEVSADNFVDNAALLQESFSKLKSLGVQLSVGVFALGHLALQKITQLPLDYLKLDQRLIRNISLYSENKKMLLALKDLSITMGLEMVVEGVDDKNKRDLLKELGFYVMQGDFFGEAEAMHSFLP
jgi:diguanylate cyclase (GGDEF)-like protein